MTLREIPGPPGAPWERALAGRVDEFVVESEILADNPLGDPTARPLYVYVPPGVEDGNAAIHPSIYMIQGFTGQIDMWFNRTFLEPNMIERLDMLFEDESVPRAIVVFVDAWTSYGGSQFINSVGTGRYLDYLCDEVVPFIDSKYPTIANAGHRGITGKSSGGYGAMVVPMLRSDVFNAFASHAGDALFEVAYAPEFREIARDLRDHFEGSYDVFWEKWNEAESPTLMGKYFGIFETYGYAACYTPDESSPGEAILPFELDTGRLIDDVWAKWLEWDPVRMAAKHGDDLAKMKLIYLDAGNMDEYFLDLGATAFAKELDKLGLDYTLEFYPTKHGGIQFRYPKAIRALAEALA
jgi:S-formylglutathione hydrolase FrmB